MTETAPWPRVGVYRVDGDRFAWMAPSRSVPGSYWLVRWHTAPNQGIWFTCTCPAGVERERMSNRYEHPCRHVRLVAVAEAADGIPDRPTPPPNVSAIMD